MNIKTKKLLIPYLEREHDVEYTEIIEENETKEVILHSTYKRLINDECNDVTYHYAYISIGEVGHYAATCAISDSNGRRVEGVGEANPSTLTTEIARKYPVQMAHKRAFDDAAMVFLGLYGNYSDSQIIPTPSNAPSSAVSSDTNTPTGTSPSSSAKQEKPAKKSGTTGKSEAAKPAPAPEAATKEEPKSVNSDAEPVDFGATESADADVVIGTLDEEPPADTPEENGEPITEDDRDPRFDTIVTFGRRKNEGLTIAQLAVKDIDSLIWISKYDNVSGDRLAQQTAALAWLEEHPEAAKRGENVA